MADERGGPSGRWLVVGLGNPGPQYMLDRHNIGFMVLDLLAEQAELAWRRAAKHRADMAVGSLSKQSIVLLKPQTYMNLSGESVSPAAHYYRITPEKIIAVHDDIDLDLGRLKVKRGGGDGGHKGIRSIAQHLGGPDFLRVRVGVGRPARGDVTKFVLQGFRADERDAADETIARAAKAVRLILTRGITEAMNRLNRVPKRERSDSGAIAAEEKEAGEGPTPSGDAKYRSP